MSHRSRIVWSILLLLGLTTHFNSCDVYSTNDSVQDFASSCTGDACLTVSADLLEVKINHDSQTSAGICLNNSVDQFNVGGECNEGGFAENEIIWTLFDNVGLVHDSRAFGLTSVCKNGRFSIFVRLTNPNTNPIVNRTGLRNAVAASPVYVPYRLQVEIRGIDERGQLHSNSLAKRSIELLPATSTSQLCL